MEADSAIWRATTLGPEVSNSTDIISFNDLTLSDESQKGIVQSSTIMSSAVAANPKPKASNDELQDTGFSGLTLTLTGSIKDPSNTGAAAGHLLKTWLIEDKTVATLFPYGRFGLRMNDFTIFNLTPSTYRGYMLSDVQFIRDGAIKGKLTVIMTLRFNGAVSSPSVPNGSGQYLW